MPSRASLGDAIALAAAAQVKEYTEQRQAILEGLVASAYGLNRKQFASLLRSHVWIQPEYVSLCLQTFEENR
jgi:hypothetical protein